MTATFIDLFAGIGGFHLAFRALGGECVFACEIDPHARATYRANFAPLDPALFETGRFAEDVAKVDPAAIPDFDVLCAGFPCQPFSQAGHKRGFDDAREGRGNMFFEIVRILEAKRPKAFFLENVRHLLSHDSGRTFAVIREILERELGYSFHCRVVKASDHGLPQHRPRVFMVGFRDERTEESRFAFPEPTPLAFTMSHVFGAPCRREIGYTLRVGGKGSGLNDRRNWDAYLVDGKVRRLSPAEGKRMMGFPDGFVLPASRTQAMKQLGNSVAVDAVRATAEKIAEYLKERETMRDYP
jgi:DNA (cytosine-5)-methyltransferase 1